MLTVEPSRPNVSRRRWLRRLMISGLVLGLTWLTLSLVVAYQLTHRSSRRFQEPSPKLQGQQGESLRLTTTDGEQIGGWFFSGREEFPSVLLLHGNNRSRKDCLPQAEFLLDEGFSVLLISQRAHGDSTGEINDLGYSARHDVVAAVRFLEEKRPKKPIAIWGISLGSASAIFAAPELGNRVNGYILESPYRDLKSAVNHRVKLFLPPVLDTAAYIGLLGVAPLFLPHYEAIAPLEAAKRVPKELPVLVLAGEQDNRTPVSDIQEITAQLGRRAKLCTMPGAGHCQLLNTDLPTYRQWTTQFLRQWILIDN